MHSRALIDSVHDGTSFREDSDILGTSINNIRALLSDIFVSPRIIKK